MRKIAHNIKYRYPPKINLCRSCQYSYGDRRRGLMCDITKQKPNFYAYCPYFSLNKARDKTAHSQDNIKVKNRINLLELWSFMLIFITLISPLLHFFGYWSVFIIIAFMLFSYSLYTKLISNKTQKIPLFAYIYTIFSSIVLKHKKTSEEDKQIIYQTIIRFFGNDIAQKALEILKQNFDYNSKNLSFLLKVITKQDRRLIYTLLFQLFAYNNVENLEAEKNILLELANIFGISYDEYLRLREIYIAREYKQKYKQEKAEKPKTDLTKQYKILGLNPKATPEQIKKQFRKLAKLYHPDKQLNKELAEQAEEQFKLILHAYKTIQKAKGIK